MFSTASKALIRAPFCMSKGMTGAVSRVLSLDGHLSGTRVAARLKPPVGTAGPAMVPVGVAADRVYRPPMLPWGAVSSYLAFPPLPAAAKPRRRYISVALFLGSPPADVIRYPCPVQPGLSSCQSKPARDRQDYSRCLLYDKIVWFVNQNCRNAQGKLEFCQGKE